MKKTVLLFSLLLIALASSNLFAQESKYDAAISKQEKLYNQQIGHHFGTEYFESYTKGVRLFYGNRLSKHWMVGGLVGADVLGKDWEEDFEDYLPKFSIPIQAEARFYFGMSRFMPYISTNLGVSLAPSLSTLDTWVGLGTDINVYKSHTLYFSAGYGGRTPFEDMDDELYGLGLFFRIGYYF